MLDAGKTLIGKAMPTRPAAIPRNALAWPAYSAGVAHPRSPNERGAPISRRTASVGAEGAMCPVDQGVFTDGQGAGQSYVFR